MNSADMLRVMRHLVDVAALKGDPTAQRQLLIDGFNRMIGTSQSFFFAAKGFVPNMKPAWSEVTVSTDLDPGALRYLAEFGAKYPLTADPYCAHSVHDTANLITLKRSEVLPDLLSQRQFADFMEVDRGVRATDGLVSMHRRGPAEDGQVVGLAMHRFGGDERTMTPHDRAMIAFAVSEVNAMIDRGHLALAPLDRPDRLPPRMQQVLDLLLAGAAPKQIALKLDLSVHTVREHIGRLYARFDVAGRDELMARFVGRSGRDSE